MQFFAPLKKDWTFLFSRKKVKVEEREGGRESERKASAKQRGTGENEGRREKRTQASGTVKQSDMDSAMAIRLTLSCSPLCLSHVGWLLMEPSYSG